MQQTDQVEAKLDGVRVILARSAGTDGAVYVMIDTDREPDGSDGGPGLRVDVNDARVYEGVPYLHDRRQDLDVEAFVDGYCESALWADCTPADRCVVCGDLVVYGKGMPNVFAWRHVDQHDHIAERDEDQETGGRKGLTLRPEARERMAVDPRRFVAENADDVLAYCDARREEIEGYVREPGDVSSEETLNVPEAWAGHDLWMTRRHHGVGFWDRGLGELGDRLMAAAQAMGEPDDHVPFDRGDGTADA